MRIIGRLDIKNHNIIQSINLEGLRVIGDPNIIGKKYYKEGIDELIFMDIVASLYGRNNIFKIIKMITKNIFIPVAVGGGIRSILDIEKALNSGADKVVINSAAIKNPRLIAEAEKKYGSSTIVISIDTRKNNNTGKWEIFTNTGREKANISLETWINKIQDLGCGEILITSIDHAGTRKGFDYDLLKFLKKFKLKIPLIYCGGCSGVQDIKKVKSYLKEDDAITISSIIHYNLEKIENLKKIVK
tara:strand:- start:4916 stop:5650 length:735 start_codon:yes stop_codon:yes gene_type:complete